MYIWCVSKNASLFFFQQNTCTLSFPANETPNEMYAVKVSVEDFPKLNIKFGSKVYTPKHSLSTVNLLVTCFYLAVIFNAHIYLEASRIKSLNKNVSQI